jgi:hypothetical protein
MILNTFSGHALHARCLRLAGVWVGHCGSWNLPVFNTRLNVPGLRTENFEKQLRPLYNLLSMGMACTHGWFLPMRGPR